MLEQLFTLRAVPCRHFVSRYINNRAFAYDDHYRFSLFSGIRMVGEACCCSSGQGGVTPIHCVLPHATWVMNFDPRFFLLTFDFAKVISLIDPHFSSEPHPYSIAHVHWRVTPIDLPTCLKAWLLTSNVLVCLTVDQDFDPDRGWQYRVNGSDTPLAEVSST